MRTINCRSVCREIEEADLEPRHQQSQHLSRAVMEHIRSCAECQSFHDQHLQLRQLLGSLVTLQAPADFDFRLRAILAGRKRDLSHRFSLSDFSVGFRWVAFATLLLLLGAGVILRGLQTGTNNSAGRLETQDSGKVDAADTQPDWVNAREAEAAGRPKPTAPPRQETMAIAPREMLFHPPQQAKPVALRNSRATEVKEFSSLSAPVVKRGDSIASTGASPVFPIDASYQSLKLSLDDGSGASRTIVLPTVSFGSQRLPARAGSPTVATSARGVW